jgi:hypothetical protein
MVRRVCCQLWLHKSLARQPYLLKDPSQLKTASEKVEIQGSYVVAWVDAGRRYLPDNFGCASARW